MSTRTAAGRLEALIEEASSLELLGRTIQGEDEATAAKAAADLDSKYRNWFASSLTALPDDLREKFRFEYEGNFFQNRIKKFLEEPLRRSSLYDSITEEAKATLGLEPWQHPFNTTFRAPLLTQKQLLIEALARFGTRTATVEGLALLEQISRRLPVSFAILRREIRGRPGIQVEDEYDVQRILHALAVLHFEEVEEEDPTPKMAGASSRLDFLLRRERIAVETKMLRESLTIKHLRQDLAVDIQYFRAHPDADALFIFVYDPDRKITNTVGFEGDLYSDSDEFPVRAVVAS